MQASESHHTGQTVNYKSRWNNHTACRSSFQIFENEQLHRNKQYGKMKHISNTPKQGAI